MNRTYFISTRGGAAPAQYYDHDAAAWDVTGNDFPQEPTAFGPQILAFDGTLAYFLSDSTGELYAYNPTMDTVSGPLANGASLNPTGMVTMTTDGTEGFIMTWNSGTTLFYAYNIGADALSPLSFPAVTGHAFQAMAWDGGTNLYIVKYNTADSTRKVMKMDITTRLFTDIADLAFAPYGGAYLNGHFYVVSYNGGTGDVTMRQYDPVGDAWATKAVINISVGNTSQMGLFPISDHQLGLLYNDGSGISSPHLAVYDATLNSWSSLPDGASHASNSNTYAMFYTLPLNLGGISFTDQSDNPVFFSNIGETPVGASIDIPLRLHFASDKTGVHLKTANGGASPTTYTLSTDGGTTFAVDVSLGDFTAGAHQDFILRASSPLGDVAGFKDAQLVVY